MCVESQNVGNAHLLKLLQHVCAVQRLAVAAAVLTAAVKQRHHNVNAVCLTTCRLNETLQILIMVIRGHVVLVAEVVVGQAIIAYVYNKEQVIAAHGRLDKALAVAGRETRAAVFDDERVHIHTGTLCPTHQMGLNLFGKLTRTGKRYDAKRCYAILCTEKRL